jgi:putative transposase
MMPIVDEYSRECLTIEVERSITAEDVVRTLGSLFERRGEPSFIRSDNGPEFIAEALKRWLEASGVRTLYIEPGSPWENAYSETFISRFSDELLKREVFTNLLEAKVLVEESIETATTASGRTALWATRHRRSLRPHASWPAQTKTL